MVNVDDVQVYVVMGQKSLKDLDFVVVLLCRKACQLRRVQLLRRDCDETVEYR
jgi:hypothetical protein